MIKNYTIHFFIGIFSLCVLAINLNWGLPNQKRTDLLGGPEFIQKKLPEINTAKNLAKDIGTSNLPYQDRIYFSIREFLVSPFAGDDNFTLNAIRKLNPYRFKMDPHYYMYGGGFIYSGAVFVQLSAWLGYTTLISNADYYLTHPQELGNIFFVLRFMVAIFATLGIVLAYHLARRYTDNTTALISTFILLITPVVHQASRAVEPHIFAVPFFILAFFYLVDFVQKDQYRPLIISAFFSGFSVGTQAISIYIGVIFFVALILYYQKASPPKSTILKLILIYGLIATMTGLAINPYYLLNFDGFMQDFNRGTGNQLLNAIKPWAPGQLSTFLLILFLIAPLYHLLHPRKSVFTKLALTGTLTAIPVYILLSNYHLPYVLTAIPLYAILTAQMLRDIHTQISSRYRHIFVTVVLIGFLVFPTTRSLYYILNFTANNREQAGAWVNTNIPPQKTIAIRYPPSVWDCVPFVFTNYHLTDYRAIDARNMPEYAVLLNADLPETQREKYTLIKEYSPTPILGYHFELAGELHALIGKTIRIYKRTTNPIQ